MDQRKQTPKPQNAMADARSDIPEPMLFTEIQVILAEKRTSLAVLRTGIAVCAVPLSVLSLLITTSKYYNASEVLQLFIPLVLLCTLLAILGGYLLLRSIVRIHRYDRLIQGLKERHQALHEVMD